MPRSIRYFHMQLRITFHWKTYYGVLLAGASYTHNLIYQTINTKNVLHVLNNGFPVGKQVH